MSNTAADSFRQNLATDEETGVTTDAFLENGNQSNSPPSSNPPQTKSRVGWIISGVLLLLCIIGLAFSMSNRNNESNEVRAVGTSAPRAPTTALDEAKETDRFTNNATASSDNGAKDSTNTLTAFTPQESVGDVALLTLPEIQTTSSPTRSPTPVPSSSPTIPPTDIPSIVPTNVPSTSSGPTGGPSADPSLHPTSWPSALPSTQPTLAPSESPTDEPTKSPTDLPTASPSTNPTKSPFNFSSWTYSAFGLEPSATPSKKPTSEPSTSPSQNPTLEPSKQPTRKPTRRPTRKPTRAPTRQPTKQPTPSPSLSPTNRPTSEPTPYEPFFFGDEFDKYEDLGINVSRGLSVRVIAETGKPVQFANGGKSKLDAHTWPDGAGVIPMNPNNPLEDGYVYVSNSEENDGEAGVYGIYFDKDGNIVDYQALQTGTTWNCGGGLTPWNTWVTCEEHEDGQCWQIDPVNRRVEKTVLGGDGGEFESVAVDNSDVDRPVFFTTEDDEMGAMRRFVASGSGWDALHSKGDHSFLRILDGETYEWTTDEDAARESAKKFYPNSEGISFHEGKIFFMSKEKKMMFVLDLENMTYETEKTGKKFYGEGSFGDEPDQNMFGPTRKYMYFTEDGGRSPGVYARFGNDGTYFTLFQAIEGGIYGNDEDETTGIALSPDGKRFYAGIQTGIIFEFTRDDGQPFE
mmetsp:Transcript_12724/g.27444  ORF Transcript_12724/g.27444 Transcript_12724/m.27444 type:complete len:687 (+) Transcript_12724:110-2170(+)